MLDKLPADILESIANKLKRHDDLENFSRACKFLREFLLPLVYESVSITVEEDNLEDVYRRAAALPSKYLKYIKDIHFTAPIHRNVADRCPFSRDLETDQQHQDATMMHPFTQSWEILKSISDAIGQNRLRSFAWELGTCVPPECGGHTFLELFQSHQSSIENLSIITDPGCVINATVNPFRYRNNMRINLNNLRSLSWRGLTDLADIYKLGTILQCSSETIRSLSLELNRGSFRNEFTPTVFGVEQGKEYKGFPNLEVLKLNRITLGEEKIGKELAIALNLAKLKVLKLTHCTDVGNLLSAFNSLNCILQLQSFEIHAELAFLNNPNVLNRHVLSEFVARAPGITDIFVNFSECMDWKPVWDSILSRKATLERLVLQHDEMEAEDFDEEIFDTSPHRDLLSLITSEDALKLPHLKCVGISASAYNLHRKWRRLSPRPRWEFIHLRYPGEELQRRRHDMVENASGVWRCTDELAAVQRRCLGHVATSFPDEKVPYYPLTALADWAFSSDGFPDLKVIAFGDFSFKGRFAEHNLLLCRNQVAASAGGGSSVNHARPLGTSDLDMRLWEFVNDNMDLLSVETNLRLFQ